MTLDELMRMASQGPPFAATAAEAAVVGRRRREFGQEAPEQQLERAQRMLITRYGPHAVRLALAGKRPTAPQPEPLLPRARLSADGRIVLALLRDRTGRWCTMWDLRVALGADPFGFGEPVVRSALRSLAASGIRVEEAVHYVVYPARGANASPYVDDSDPWTLSQRPAAPSGGRTERENVWRLP